MLLPGLIEVEIKTGDILLIGKRLEPFFVLKGLPKAPFELLFTFSTPSVILDLGSYGIQKKTLSLWNHVEVMINDGGKITSIGAHPGGVKESDPLTAYPFHKYRWMILRAPISDEQRQDLLERARKMIGVKYSLWTIMKINFINTFGGLDELNRSLAEKKGDTDPMVCSQLADKLLSKYIDILPHVKDFAQPASFDHSPHLQYVYGNL